MDLEVTELDESDSENTESNNDNYKGSTDDERSEIMDDIAVADRANEYPPPGDNNEIVLEEENVTRTRLRRISRLYDYAKHFPETAHF